MSNMPYVRIPFAQYNHHTLNYSQLREHSTLNEYSHHKKNPSCNALNCNNTAYFLDSDDINLYPVRCSEHKINTDIQLINRECSNCKELIYFPANRKICMECGQYRIRTLRCFKEHMVKYFLQSNNILFIHNRPILTNESKYRPDFLINTKFGYVIVEVDKHQHKAHSYTKENELIRMNAIYLDIQKFNPEAQVLFIRYNTDNYKGIQYNTQQRTHYLYNVITYFINQKDIGAKLAELYIL